MTSTDTVAAHPRRGRVAAATLLRALLGAWRSERTWRATLHALLGLPAALVAGVLLSGVVVVWSAAVWSLGDGVAGRPVAVTSYAIVVLAGPAVLLGSVALLGGLQRARFRTVLGVDIPAPPPEASRWHVRLLRRWQSAATWRQFGYHLIALIVGPIGGLLVAACWAASVLAVTTTVGLAGQRSALGLALVAPVLLLIAPWVARAVSTVDEAAARSLLGPSRSQELALRVEWLARSRAEVVAATDAERRRIERDLHDGAQQRLVSLAMKLGLARATLVDVPDSARRAIEQAHDEATQALAELRELVRGMHPAVLNDRGLDAALSGIAARAPLPVRLRVDVPTRCAPSIEAVAYFVVSEALTNVAKHARASHAEVTVDRVGQRLRVVVSDDGRGGAAADVGPGGTGLRGLAQRTAAVDGTLSVHSPAGGPTTITVELPCES